jgi:hypothetical protein
MEPLLPLPRSHLANKYMRQYHSHSVEQDVEWLYAFDVHANAFFCSFLVTYVLQVSNLLQLCSGVALRSEIVTSAPPGSDVFVGP